MMEKFAEYSQNIEQAIASQKWDSLTELLVQRQQFLESFFSNPIESREKVRQEVERILERDQVSIQQLNYLKRQVSEQLLQLNRGRKTIKKYLE